MVPLVRDFSQSTILVVLSISMSMSPIKLEFHVSPCRDFEPGQAHGSEVG